MAASLWWRRRVACAQRRVLPSIGAAINVAIIDRCATTTRKQVATPDVMARIAVGGFQHETNTFSPVNATYADFEAPDAWPGLTRGPALFDAVAGINLPAAGFVREARGLHHELVALSWCQAQPSGRVTR